MQASIERSEIRSFFEHHRDEFAPLAIYRAKTRGRFEKQFQLSFVDIGLVSLVEGDIGRALGRVVERVAAEIKHEMGAGDMIERSKEWLFQSASGCSRQRFFTTKVLPILSSVAKISKGLDYKSSMNSISEVKFPVRPWDSLMYLQRGD